MVFSTILLYMTTCFAVTVLPGPTMLLALSNGVSRRWNVVMMGMLGAALSDLLLIGAVCVGLGTVLAASEVVFSAVKWIGVCYLVWLAVQLWRARPVNLSARAGGESVGARTAFQRSLVVALSNPKGLLFFSAFLPQFIDPLMPQIPQYVELALLTAAQDIAVMAIYAAAGSKAAQLLTLSGLRRLNQSCAAALLSLAAFLALVRRSNA